MTTTTTTATPHAATYADGYGVWHATTLDVPGAHEAASNAIYLAIAERVQRRSEALTDVLAAVRLAVAVVRVPDTDLARECGVAEWVEVARCECGNPVPLGDNSDHCEYCEPHEHTAPTRAHEFSWPAHICQRCRLMAQDCCESATECPA